MNNSLDTTHAPPASRRRRMVLLIGMQAAHKSFQLFRRQRHVFIVQRALSIPMVRSTVTPKAATGLVLSAMHPLLVTKSTSLRSEAALQRRLAQWRWSPLVAMTVAIIITIRTPINAIIVRTMLTLHLR